MNTKQQKLAVLLTYAGLLPIWLAVANQVLQWLPIDTVFWASAYAAVIAAFICGIHWAVFLFFADRSPVNLLLTSNLICLTAWAGLLLSGTSAASLIFIGCFIGLLAIDSRLRAAGLIPPWFYRLRVQASTGMVIGLAALHWAVP
jgi:hypothetical protein